MLTLMDLLDDESFLSKVGPPDIDFKSFDEDVAISDSIVNMSKIITDADLALFIGI